MFSNATKKELQWLDNGRVIGIVRINEKFNFQNRTTRPFVRNSKREIISIGKVNYALLDNFIVNSLKDYYSKISMTKNQTEKNERTIKYNELYQLWYKVQSAKQTGDIQLNNYYDDIIYYLYLLGYHNG